MITEWDDIVGCFLVSWVHVVSFLLSLIPSPWLSLAHLSCSWSPLILRSICDSFHTFWFIWLPILAWAPSVNHLLQWNKYRLLSLPAVGSKHFNISHLLSFPSTLIQHPKWSIISNIGNKCVNTLFKVLHFHCTHCGQKKFLNIRHWNCLFQKPPALYPHIWGNRDNCCIYADLVLRAFHTSSARPLFPH